MKRLRGGQLNTPKSNGIRRENGSEGCAELSVGRVKDNFGGAYSGVLDANILSPIVGIWIGKVRSREDFEHIVAEVHSQRGDAYATSRMLWI